MKPQPGPTCRRAGRIFCCFLTLGLVGMAAALFVENIHQERAFGQSPAVAVADPVKPPKAKLLPKGRNLPHGQQPLTLQFKIEGGEKSPSFSIACSGGAFQYLRDRGNAEQTNVMSVEGNVKLLGSGKVSVSFEFKVQESNEQKNVENTIQIKGNSVLKIGGKAKLAQIGDEGSLLLTVVKAE